MKGNSLEGKLLRTVKKHLRVAKSGGVWSLGIAIGLEKKPDNTRKKMRLSGAIREEKLGR